MKGDPAQVVRAGEAADWLLSRGQGAATTDDLARLLAIPADQVRRRLHAPASRGHWVMPVRGLWVPVPPEYRTWGAPPGIEIIDSMMNHLGAAYYVGWLSAAAIHGAAHQAPQVFQVATDHMVRSRIVGRTRFDFRRRSATATLPVITHPTDSGSARVATASLTVLDVASDTAIVAGPDNAATVIVELAESDSFDISELVELAPHFPASAVRRIGYLLDRFSDQTGLDLLGSIAQRGPRTPSRLDAAGPASGPIDRTWHLYVNREIEPDL